LVLAGMVDHADPHPTRVAAPASPPLFDQDAAEPLPAPPAPPKRSSKLRKPRRQRAKGQRRLVPYVVAAVLVAVVALAASAFTGVDGASAIATPGLTGRQEAKAKALAEQRGLSVSVQRRPGPDPSGVVVDQSPRAGAWTSGKTVKLVVSSGPAPVIVPPITGTPWPRAQKQLDAIGFAYGPPVQEFSDSVPANAVIRVTPDVGARVAPDASVVVVISKGRAPVTVPDVTKQSSADAVASLAASHLKAKRGRDVFSNDVPAGQVVSTSPPVGEQAPYNSTVQIFVSHGPIMARVPNVLNLSFADASARLGAKGFQFSVNGPVRGGDVVVRQSPDRNSNVPLETTTIELTFGPQQ
jgi:serine/threonine-protein kinase